MDLERQVGLRRNGSVVVPDRRAMIRSIVLKLAAMGAQVPELVGDAEVLDLARDLFARYREQSRLLSDHLCPADRRIQNFLDELFAPLELDQPVRLPCETLISIATDSVASSRCRSMRRSGTTRCFRATAWTAACCTIR